MADVERTRRILAIELLLKRIMTLQHEQDVARQTIADKDKLIERLAENSKALAEVMREEWNERSRRLWAHDELLAELEGKG